MYQWQRVRSVVENVRWSLDAVTCSVHRPIVARSELVRTTLPLACYTHQNIPCPLTPGCPSGTEGPGSQYLLNKFDTEPSDYKTRHCTGHWVRLPLTSGCQNS